MNLRVKTDKTSWLLLSVGVISLILCIIAIAAQKYAFMPLLGFSTVSFQVFYDRLRVKRSSYDFVQRSGLSNNKLKQKLDKYEITLLTILNSILLVGTSVSDGFISINYSFIIPLIIVAGALLLVGIAYHIDRKNDWKKQQQSLTPSTL